MSTLGADSPGRLLRSVFAASPSAAAFVTTGRGNDFPTPSSPLSVASDDSADLDTVANAVLPRADARVTAIRDHLRAQGLQDVAIDQILLHNWAESTTGGHDSAWHQWERHCDERLDAARRDNPSAADLVNFQCNTEALPN